MRGRDIVAVLLAVVLARMATEQDNTSDALSASLRLAFYTPGRLSAALDVDGDGDAEALVVASYHESDQQWVLQVQDLTPMHHPSFTTAGAPFVPSVLVSSSQTTKTTAKGVVDDPAASRPLQMKTGQLLLHHHKRMASSSFSKRKSSFVASDDRTRHYFCGSDWHQAAQNCHVACPSGDSSSCPEGETCFADTPCDSQQPQHEQEDDDEAVKLQNLFSVTTTPLGGLPSVATLWADGGVTMHTLTTTAAQEEEKSHRHDKKQQLELKFLWNYTLPSFITLDSAQLTFVGAQDVVIHDKSNLGRHGMILIGASSNGSSSGRKEDDTHVSVLYALDALTGKVMWDTAPDEPASATAEGFTNGTVPILPFERGTSSVARRRSRIVAWRSDHHDEHLPDCLLAFRHSLLAKNSQALPYAYWGPQDAKALLLHIDRNAQHPHHHHRVAKKREQAKVNAAHKVTSKQQKRHRRRHKAVFGRPNVILTHSQDGIHVRSLKNGRALCHLSLLDKVLYADLDRDGSLDSVHVITDHIQDVSQHDNEWIADLARQVENSEERQSHRPRRLIRTNRLCHVLGLSGTPAREEMFAANLCGGGAFAKERGDHASSALEPAPPLVVDGTDVVVALNNGIVRRYHAPSGRNQWSRNLEDTGDFPVWLVDSKAAFLTSLDVANAAPRPILMAGANSMMLLSPGRGKVMAHAVFPQLSVGRPYLADVSGDGTEDIMIQSADAIFGYQVVVHAGSSILIRVLVGLLLMGMALALLRNRFAQRNGADKRSTDA